MMRGLLISYLSPFLTEAPTVDSRGSGMTYNKAHNAQVMSLPHHDGFFLDVCLWLPFLDCFLLEVSSYSD